MAETTQFPRRWRAEVLDRPPLIAPARRFTFPFNIPGEEDALARGALELMVRPDAGGAFLATCALGYTSRNVPTGIWGTPTPTEICAVAGGYAYLIDTTELERTTLLTLRPIVEVREAVEDALLLLVSFNTLVGWGVNGQQWETARLSWEGLRLGEIRDGQLHGFGWEMRSDKELPFAIDLRTGEHTGGGYLR